uniref:ascorbate ferrireductase (transmembrane) n=1 Tax=Romanomermis culicivorax TaxID=13658 RepID=A0A915HWQ3_ROMCU
MEDGELYPWATNEPLNLADSLIVQSMKQTDVARSLQYNLVKVHGIFMLFAWWVFGSAAILTARFMKNFFTGRRLAGSPIWFQIHRTFMILALILQCLAFAAIFVQAGDFKMCTLACETDYYLLKLHTILGVSCTSGALFQPLLAFFRFSNEDPRRPIFNWLHWFVGVGSWTMASVCIFLAPFLPKNGLRYHFGYKADYIMAGYICSFILTSISMEILSSLCSNSKITPIVISNRPKKSSNVDDLASVNKFSKIQVINLILFAIVSCFLCIALGALIALNELI